MSQKKIIIDSNLAGVRTRPFKYMVSARHISNYAAAISDQNNIYYVSDNQDVLCVHPLFTVRISWEIIKNLSEYLEIETPFNIKNPLVHQSEYLQFNRLPQSGDERFYGLADAALGVFVWGNTEAVALSIIGIMLAVLIAFSWMTYRLIEAPGRDWMRKQASQGQLVVPAYR